MGKLSEVLMQPDRSKKSEAQGLADRDTQWRLVVTAIILGLLALSIWAGQS